MAVLNKKSSRIEDLGRITESRTDPQWGCSPSRIKNLGWFEGRKYTAARLSLGHKTDQQFYVYDSTSLIIKPDFRVLKKKLSSCFLDAILNPR